MEIVKFVRSQNMGIGRIEYFFKISDKIATLIREYSNYPKDKLLSDLTKENEYIYRIGTIFDEKLPELDDTTIETIEQISNKYDEEGFWNSLLTDNGKYRPPSLVHRMIENEFSLTEDQEWWVAHFFIGLSGLIFSHGYDKD